MARLFIVLKRKGDKLFTGAIPVKRGVSKLRAEKVMRSSIKKGFVGRVVSEITLRKLIVAQTKKRLVLRKRPTKRRTTRRKKAPKRRRRK